jgi:NTE family protein
LGTDLLLQSEFYQPFGSQLKFFVAPHIGWQQRNLNVFESQQNEAQLRVAEAKIGFDIGTEIFNIGEFRAGVYSGSGDVRRKIGDPGVPEFDYGLGGVFALLRMDTFDAPRFPRTGFGMNLKWDMSRVGLGADADLDKLDFDILTAWSKDKNTLALGLSYATTFSVVDQVQEYTQLGGFLRLSGLNFGALSGPHAAVGNLVYYRLLGDSARGLFDAPVYLGGSLEAGNVWQDQSDIGLDSLIASGSIFLAFDTFFGAVYVAAGFAEGGEQAYYLSIGSALGAQIR